VKTRFRRLSDVAVRVQFGTGARQPASRTVRAPAAVPCRAVLDPPRARGSTAQSRRCIRRRREKKVQYAERPPSTRCKRSTRPLQWQRAERGARVVGRRGLEGTVWSVARRTVWQGGNACLPGDAPPLHGNRDLVTWSGMAHPSRPSARRGHAGARCGTCVRRPLAQRARVHTAELGSYHWGAGHWFMLGGLRIR